MSKYNEKIVKLILKKLDGEKIDFIYVFGSYAVQKQRKDSDVDIAFYSNKNYDEYRLFLVKNDISKIINHEVDLVQLKNSSTVFQKEVVSKGILIYEKDKNIRQNFEMVVMKKYMKLNQERAEIIENYNIN